MKDYEVASAEIEEQRMNYIEQWDGSDWKESE